MGLFNTADTPRTRTRGAVNLVSNELSNVSDIFTSTVRRLEGLVAVCNERQSDLDVQIDELMADKRRIEETSERAETILKNLNGLLGFDPTELDDLSESVE